MERKCPKCGCRFQLGRNAKQVLCDPCELTDFAEHEAGGNTRARIVPPNMDRTERLHRTREIEAKRIGATFDMTKDRKSVV